MPCETLFEVEPYLLGLMYPATKEEIMEQARKNNADRLTLKVFNSLSKETYYSHPEIFKEIGEKWKEGKETLIPRADQGTEK